MLHFCVFQRFVHYCDALRCIIIHVQVLLSFHQPTFHEFSKTIVFSAAWSAFHVKHVAICCVSRELRKCRLLK